MMTTIHKAASIHSHQAAIAVQDAYHKVSQAHKAVKDAQASLHLVSKRRGDPRIEMHKTHLTQQRVRLVRAQEALEAAKAFQAQAGAHLLRARG